MEYEQLLEVLPDEEMVEPVLNVLTVTIVSIFSVIIAASMYLLKRGLLPQFSGLSMLGNDSRIAGDSASIEASLVRAGILTPLAPMLPVVEPEPAEPEIDRKPTGYLHSQYACSLSAFGIPYYLPEARGWLIRRPIPNHPYYDAMGTYPIFCCADWSKLPGDLLDMGRQIVCVSMVTDPFGNHSPRELRKFFTDVFYPYKEHLISDLMLPDSELISPHHRRNLRKARTTVEVHLCESPETFLDDWTSMYENLVRRHKIIGIPVFSRTAFVRQLTVPGIVAFRAEENGKTVGMLLWYPQGDVGYYHLGAYSPRGYELSASYPLFESAIHYFRSEGFRWLSLGAGAGVRGNHLDGLTRFKMGWASWSRTAYLCGRIFNHDAYEKIARNAGKAHSNFFPAYRDGEFCASWNMDR